MDNWACISGHSLEFIAYTGYYQGVPVTVASHGVGVGGSQICFKELMDCGARVIIRAGTCGSFLPEYAVGAMMIPHSLVRDEKVTSQLIPASFPAVCDFRLIEALERASKRREAKYLIGMGVTIGIFEPYGGPLADSTRFWKGTTAPVCVDMETAQLCVLGQLRGVQVGAILLTDGYVFNNTAGAGDETVPITVTRYEDDQQFGDYLIANMTESELLISSVSPVLCPGMTRMVKIALDALVEVAF